MKRMSDGFGKKMFSQWTEILPIDQVMATKYKLTGL